MKRAFSFNKLSKFSVPNYNLSKSRSICLTSYKFQNVDPKVNQPKEVKIDVPWGHVAGKWYGPQNVRPVLMIHGWQDNAGTFNTLIPHLPQHLSYLSIDLPGHGLSSRLPNSIIYSVMSYMHTISFIRHHYKWNQISFCCHSMGAILSHLYCMLYPKNCEFLIGLDGMLKPHKYPIEKKIERLRLLGNEFLMLDHLNQSGKEPPAYAYDEVKKRCMKLHNLTPDAAVQLLERGVKQSKADPKRYYFSRDVRLKLMEYPPFKIQDDIQFKLMEEMKVPFLLIKVNKTKEFETIEKYRKPLDILNANNPNFALTTVVGPHHVHLTDPPVVSDHISNFINKYRPPSPLKSN